MGFSIKIHSSTIIKLFFLLTFLSVISSQAILVSDSEETQNKELIIYFHKYMNNEEVNECLLPLASMINVKESVNYNKQSDFVVITLKDNLIPIKTTGDLESEITNLS